MVNTAPTQLSRNALPRRDRSVNVAQLLRGVRQDNPAPNTARTATPQPAPPHNAMRPTPKKTNTPRPHKGKTKQRKTVHLTLWVKPGVKAELARTAASEGLSVSSVGAAFLDQAIRQDIHSQYGTLIEPIIEQAIRKHMRAYSNRLAILLVRSLFASEQMRGLVTNILSRQPGVTQPVLEEILNGSSSAAKRNITRLTPQLAALVEEIKTWMEEAKPDE